MDTEERGLSSRMAKEEMFKGDKKAKKQYRDASGAGMLSNETLVAKRLKPNSFQPYIMKQLPVAEIEPRKNQ
ncbi:homeotic protein proboscipedia-like, partial [Trifolium medium]|nr:homeotic protein proboscipedia-like [Trifolium medium]